MTITQVSDHAAQAQDRLPDHLQGASNLLTLLSILASPFQDIEDLLIALLEKRHLDAATGIQIDRLGTILNLDREVGQSDASYRAALQAEAALIQRSGEAENLIEAFKAIQSATLAYLIEHQPATVELEALVENDDPVLDADTIEGIRRVKAGGIGMILAAGESPLFLWGDVADTDANGDLPVSIHGWGDVADTDANGDLDPGEGGGNFSRLIT